MPRPRNPENKALPARWRRQHGAYYYQVPPGLESHWDGKKSFRLGATLPEAYAEFARRMKGDVNTTTVGGLLDRYALQVVPTKAAKSRTENARHLAMLRSVFGTLPLDAIKPRHVYLYVDKRSVKKPNDKGVMTGGRTVAHREIEVLSHAFTKAVEWGLLDRHPFKGEVRLEGEAPRDRYVEDHEIAALLAIKPRRKKGSARMVQTYIRLKLLTGLRRGDLLRLTMEAIREDGIHVQPSKTRGSSGVRQIFTWDAGGLRRAAVEDAKAARPCLSPWLFCNDVGASYFDEDTGTASGWDSLWNRFMTRAVSEGHLKTRFTEHDLRAKAGSDQETLERARALLGHTDSRTTARVYRRKPEEV